MNEPLVEKLLAYATRPVKTADSRVLGECIDNRKLIELVVLECCNEIRHKSFEVLDIDFWPHYNERLTKHFGVTL